MEVEAQRSESSEGKLWQIAEQEGQVRLLVTADQAVLAGASADTAEDSLRVLMGFDRPARSLADSGELREVEQQHGFTPHGVARFDLLRLLSEVEQPSNPVSREMLGEGLRFDEPSCSEEIRSIAARFPGVVMGTRKMDLQGLDLVIVMLTDSQLAADLATLPAPIPGLGGQDGLASLGFGMQLPKLTTLLGRWASALSATPYTCEGLAGLNDMAGGMRQAAANPGLLMAGPAASGLMLRLDRLDVSDLENPDFAGVGVLASPSPQGLVAMGSGFVPPLAEMNLSPGGDAQPLPADLLEGPLRSAWVALSEQAIALAFNADGQVAKSALGAAPSPADLLLYLHFSGELYPAFGKVMAEAGGDDPQMQRMAVEFERYADLYDYSDVWIRTGPHGVELGIGSRFR
jgi:hypothetical protein